MTGEVFPQLGSYRATRMPVEALATIDVRPADLAGILRRAVSDGWPESVAELSG